MGGGGGGNRPGYRGCVRQLLLLWSGDVVVLRRSTVRVHSRGIGAGGREADGRSMLLLAGGGVEVEEVGNATPTVVVAAAAVRFGGEGTEEIPSTAQCTQLFSAHTHSTTHSFWADRNRGIGENNVSARVGGIFTRKESMPLDKYTSKIPSYQVLKSLLPPPLLLPRSL